MATEIGIRELLEAGVHFGHQTRRWNPKMRRFIFGERGGIHIIDLQKTERLLHQAQEFAAELTGRGGTILFVGTKKQARDAIKEAANSCGMVLAASFPVTFFIATLRPRREHVSWAIAVVYLGVLWIGLPMVLAVWLRDLPHGDGLLIDVLVATFLGDTAAYFGGRIYGRTPLAPLISPNKTLEGFAAGVIGGTAAFWVAGLYQDWLTGPHALLIGALVALAAPVGDLFESMIKRDLGTKDTGNMFGPHGGVLDRLDAVLFTVVAGYYLSVAFVY